MRFLHVIEGPDQGASFVLADLEPQLVGRSSESLPLNDSTISRRHAELTPDGRDWYINDLESTNGTRVNGRRVVGRTLLERGSRIECGSTVLLFDEDPGGDPAVQVLEDDGIRTELRRERGGGSDVHADAPERGPIDPLSLLVQGTDLAVGGFDHLEYLERLLELVLEAFPARNAVAVVNAGESSGTRSMVAARSDSANGEPISINERLMMDAIRHPGLVQALEYRIGSDEPDRVLVAATLQVGDGTGGVIMMELESDSDRAMLSDEQLKLLHGLCGQAGMALERAVLVEELLGKSRMAAMGETVAAISHGVKNILQGLRGGTDAVALAIERGDLEMAGRGWGVLARNLERIQSLTLNMLGFARSRELELETVSLDHILAEAVQLLGEASSRAGVSVRRSLPSDVPPIALDQTSILQLMLNLLSNAIDASPRNGLITITGRYLEETSRMQLEVSDEGTGIEPAMRERLFEPFVSSKGQRGTGLGLVVSRKIAERHGGTLECLSTGPGGTTMRLELPGDLAEADPGDTDTPQGLGDGEFDIEFGPPEH